jgi:hypothetical protein
MKSNFKQMPSDMGLDDNVVSIGIIQTDIVDVSRLGKRFSNFRARIPLSQYLTCSRTIVTTQNMYAYH